MLAQSSWVLGDLLEMFFDLFSALLKDKGTRYLNSAVPQMQRILNSDKKKKIEILRQLSSYPVNNDLSKSVSLR